jgi:hypothetical protein
MKKRNSKLKLNRQSILKLTDNIKGGAAAEADYAAAAAGSGQAKDTCQWSSCGNCHSWKCNIS